MSHHLNLSATLLPSRTSVSPSPPSFFTNIQRLHSPYLPTSNLLTSPLPSPQPLWSPPVCRLHPEKLQHAARDLQGVEQRLWGLQQRSWGGRGGGRGHGVWGEWSGGHGGGDDGSERPPHGAFCMQRPWGCVRRGRTQGEMSQTHFLCQIVGAVCVCLCVLVYCWCISVCVRLSHPAGCVSAFKIQSPATSNKCMMSSTAFALVCWSPFMVLSGTADCLHTHTHTHTYTSGCCY